MFGWEFGSRKQQSSANVHFGLTIGNHCCFVSQISFDGLVRSHTLPSPFIFFSSCYICRLFLIARYLPFTIMDQKWERERERGVIDPNVTKFYSLYFTFLHLPLLIRFCFLLFPFVQYYSVLAYDLARFRAIPLRLRSMLALNLKRISQSNFVECKNAIVSLALSPLPCVFVFIGKICLIPFILFVLMFVCVLWTNHHHRDDRPQDGSRDRKLLIHAR